MTDICPTCGQTIMKHINDDEGALLHLLQTTPPHREVYRSDDGRWYVTHGGGEWSGRAVHALVLAGKVSSVYSDCPNDCYHIGRTLDTIATSEQRKRLGKKAPLIFLP